MTARLRRPAFLALVLVMASAPLAAQISRLVPEKPAWGETVVLSYDPAAAGAKFQPGDKIEALWTILAGEATLKGFVRLEKKDGLLQGRLRIPEKSGFLTVYFINGDGWDEKAGLGAMIFRPDGAPAEKAWHGKMLFDFDEAGYQTAFDEERRLYPGNHSIYRDKWFIEGAFKKGGLAAIVQADMAGLAKPGLAASAGLLRALASGHMHLGDEPAARAVLRRMAKEFPESEQTAGAFSDYEYQVFSKQIQGSGPEEMKALKRALLLAHSGAQALREELLSMAWDEKVSLPDVKAVAGPWLKDAPDDPMPRFALASAMLKKGGSLEEAAGLAEKALELLVAGKLRYSMDVSGSLTQMYLPSYYALAAEIHEKLGRPAQALAEIKAAQAVSKEVRAETFAVEGSLWRGVGRFKKAGEALLEARRRGHAKAEEALRGLYRERRGTEEGFSSWLAEAEKTAAPVSGSARKPAPEAAFRTIDGRTLRLADLRGKVVVLTFWYIGCAPCRVEIPGLNALVREFDGRDVVFLGVALDKAPALEEYLKDNAFAYQVVPEGQALAASFGVSVYPTHILINKRGEIEFFMTGGSPKRHDDLRPLIENLLK